jgi:hypothetical protein
MRALMCRKEEIGQRLKIMGKSWKMDENEMDNKNML